MVPALRELLSVGQIPEALVVVMVVQSVGGMLGPVLSGALADATGSYLPGIFLGSMLVAVGGVAGSIVMYWRFCLQKATDHPKVVENVAADAEATVEVPETDVESGGADAGFAEIQCGVTTV